MKKNMLKIATIVLLAAALGSCMKGKTGPQGPQGAPGINGTNGTNGNANVTAGTITLSQADWTYYSDGWQYYTFLTSSGITQSVVDNGTVEMFILVNNSPTVWQPLPYTFYYSNTQSYIYGYNYYLGGVKLFIDMSDNSTFTSITTVSFKMVVIDGHQRKANPNLNWKDYNKIKEALGSSVVEFDIKSN